jgi:serine protease Do
MIMMLRVFKPLLGLVLLILVVGLACGPDATETPESPQPVQEPVQQPVEPPEQPAEQPQPEQPAQVAEPGAVSNLQDVRNAVIQIEAQGTFVDPSTFQSVAGAGRGSGFIIDPSGLAVTNNHVVTGAALLKVWIGGDTSTTYNARVLGVSECSDLAVIDIEGDGFSYLEWRQDPITVGLDVYTAGFPLGDPEYTLTKGIVSKENAGGETNWASVDSVIMHDATINPGNSGGPLVDADGKVVAINYAAYKAADQYFAIGRDVAIPVINQLKTGVDVDSIGVNGEAVLSDDGTLYGIWVSSVKSGSPAEKTGIAGGDIITSLEGFPLATDGTMADYCDIIRTHSPQDTVAVEILRFATSEVLEGQLNGTVLETTYSFGDTLEGETDVQAGGAYGSYATVYDDTGAIAVDVPATWDELDGQKWEASWGGYNFTAASIVATGDMNAYNNTWSEPGVWFAASEDWGRQGGYVQLLDGVKDWYSGDCKLDGRYDYGDEDPVFEGKYDLWTNCGGIGTAAIVIAARPRANPQEYLVLVQVIVVSDADIDALDQILNTFDRVGPLP